MMASKKEKVVFLCDECGYESPSWMGQCICGSWNTLKEMKLPEPEKSKKNHHGHRATTNEAMPTSIMDIRSSGVFERLDTGIHELNRVLGGGVVKGSLILISGEPGIGKSTIIIQAAANISKQYGKVLYVSGEESTEQIKLRGDRVKALHDNLFLVSETNVKKIEEHVEAIKPSFIIIDSIQTMFVPEVSSAPGSTGQVRECGNYMMRLGKTKNIPIFIVAHVTKSGDLAGPKIVEHLVDVVLHFTGERNQELRIIRANKNRYGTTSEIGAFEMKEEGLIEIEKASLNFIQGIDRVVEGSISTATYEGSRPIFMEVQGLSVGANPGFARRIAIGIDNQRLNMITAILEKKTGISFINKDIYVNVVGGLKLEGTFADLAIALALYSSIKNIPIPGDRFFAIGEIGLTGELRPLKNVDKIIGEAKRMGFEEVIMPFSNKESLSKTSSKIKIHGVRNLNEAIEILSKVKIQSCD